MANWWRRNQHTLWFCDLLTSTLLLGYALGLGAWPALPFLFVAQAWAVLGFLRSEP